MGGDRCTSDRMRNIAAKITGIAKPYSSILCIGCQAEWFSAYYRGSRHFKAAYVPYYPAEYEIDFGSYDLIFIYDSKFIRSLDKLFEKITEGTDIILDGQYVLPSDCIYETVPINVFNDAAYHQIGSVVRDSGVYKVRIASGESGLALYGPYVDLPPGRYTVAFIFSGYPALETSEEFPVCEVSAESHRNLGKIASSIVTSRELAYSDIFCLDFELPEAAEMEFKVVSFGRIPFSVNCETELRSNYSASKMSHQCPVTYSQMGEDIIIKFIFDNVIKSPLKFYFDFGANFPVKISNTYYFYYMSDASGVCIEANPCLAGIFAEERPRDTVLNLGLVSENMLRAFPDGMDFYILDADGLSGFDKEQANRYAAEGVAKIMDVVNVPVTTINALFEKYYNNDVDFVSLDIEGMELDILKDLDFEKYRPKVFCIETVDNECGKIIKNNRIFDFMLSKGYEMVADTFINTIFIDGIYLKRFGEK